MVVVKCSCGNEKTVEDLRDVNLFMKKKYICPDCLKKKKKTKNERKKELEEYWNSTVVPERMKFFKANLEKEKIKFLNKFLGGE